jgi:hypothetical protein
MKRRDFFKTAGIGSASLVTLSTLTDALVSPALASPSLDGQPANPFSILLSGPYKPVAKCPHLGLSQVNVCDGSFSTTKIYAVSGLPLDDGGEADSGNRAIFPDRESAIGRFYVQFAPDRNGKQHCAYDLPGGTLAMLFTAINLAPIPDGHGGTYLIGPAQLNITEATGAYQSFVGGSNTMVDILRQLPDGSFVEDCFCNIYRR